MESAEKTYQELLDENNHLQDKLTRYEKSFVYSSKIASQLLSDPENNLFKIIFEQVNIGLAIIAADGNFIECNPSFCQITGYSQKELKTLNYNILHHTEDVRVDEESLFSIQNAELDDFETQKKYIHKSGNIVWLKIKVQIIKDAKGAFQYSVLAAEDISEKKILEDLEIRVAKINSNIDSLSIDEIINIALDETKDISKSEISCFYLINKDLEEIDLYRSSNNNFQPESKSWQQCLETKKAIINKNTQEQNNEIIIPLLKSSKVVAILGAVGKKDGYKDTDIKILSFLLNNLWEIIIRKQIEGQLSESENNFSTFFNTVNDFLFAFDSSGSIIEVNKTITDLLGYSRLDIIGQPVVIIHPEDRREEAAQLFSEIVNKKITNCSLPLQTKSGKIIPAETSVSSGFWDGREVYFGVSKNLSRLKYSEEKFSKVFHTNPAICALINVNTDEFAEVNETFYKKLGYSHTEIIGKKLTEFIKLPDNFKIRRKNEVDRNEIVNSLEFKIPTKDGRLIPALVYGEIIKLQEKKYLYLVALDIAKRKETEQKLKKSEQLLKDAQNIAQLGHYVFNILENSWTSSESLDDLFGLKKDYKKTIETWVNIVHPDFKNEMLKYLQENILVNHEVFDKEYKIRKISTNEEKWVHGKGVLKFNNKGQAIKMIGAIQDITQRKEAELKVWKNENALRLIIESSIGKGGNPFFESMVLSLQKITNSDYTFIGELTKNNTIVTTAICKNDRLIENFKYKLKNTPCENVVQKRTCIYKEKITDLFPKDQSLIDMGIEAYVGTPIFDHTGNGIGLIVSLYCRPITESFFAKSIFEICSYSIGAEIQRSKSEFKVRENEQTLNTIFDNAPVIMMLLDDKGNIVQVNRTGINLLNITSEDFRSNTDGDLINCIAHLDSTYGCGIPNVCQTCSVRNAFLRTLKTGKPVIKIEAELSSNQDGKEFIHTFLVSSSRIERDGKFNVLLSLDDVTEEKKMENKILESELTLNKIFDSAPIIMMLLDENTKVIKINKSIFGNDELESGSALGLNCGDVLQCVGSAFDSTRKKESELCQNCIVQNTVEQTLKTGEEVHKKEADVITLNKAEMKLKTFLISSSLIEKGSEKKVLLTLDDITERKKIEEQLIFSKEKSAYNEKRYALLANLTFEGIMLHLDGKIIDANKALSKMSGYNYEELIGQNSMNFLFPEEYKNIFEGKMLEKHSTPYETEIIRKDKTLIPIEMESRYFKQNNQNIRVSAIRNIADRKLGEKKILHAIVQTEENERARFAQELHDGLGPILSNVQMYFQWLAEADDNKQFVMDKGNLSLKNAFSTLREISNNLSPHILHNFGLSHAINSFFETIAVKNIRFDFKTNIETIRFDNNIEIALYRIITELINNSIKYSGANRIKVEINLDTDILFAVYKDNGAGFDVEKILKHSKGFGMINIQNRIKAIQGTIDFKSDKNVGFMVEIKVGVSN